jgi:hypothetical protein
VDGVARVQDERQQTSPTLRRLLWSCDPGAMNGSWLARLLQDLQRVNKADFAAQETFSRHIV